MEGQFSIFDIFPKEFLASDIPSDVIDDVLRTGSGQRNSLLRIVFNYMVDQTPEEKTTYLKKEYGTSGKGLIIDGQKYAVWYDGDGIQVTAGPTVHDKQQKNTFLTWNDVRDRIQDLIDKGEYVSHDIIEAARANEIKEQSDSLFFLERDLHGDAAKRFRERYKDLFVYVYPDSMNNIETFLGDPDNLNEMLDSLIGVKTDVSTEHKTALWVNRKLTETIHELKKLAGKPISISVADGFEMKSPEPFITSDCIDLFICKGGAYSDSKLRTLSFYENHEDHQERTEYMKKEHGVGGGSHAFSDDSNSDYNAKGLTLRIGGFGSDAKATAFLTWNDVAKRVDRLISEGRYLQENDYDHIPLYEQEQMALKVLWFYDRLPMDIERPFQGSLFTYHETKKELCAVISDQHGFSQLLQKMDNLMESLPEDQKTDDRKDLLNELHGYSDGTFTLFPKTRAQKKSTIELEPESVGQAERIELDPEDRNHHAAPRRDPAEEYIPASAQDQGETRQQREPDGYEL